MWLSSQKYSDINNKFNENDYMIERLEKIVEEQRVAINRLETNVFKSEAKIYIIGGRIYNEATPNYDKSRIKKAEEKIKAIFEYFNIEEKRIPATGEKITVCKKGKAKNAKV